MKDATPKKTGTFAVLVNTGYRYDFYMNVQAASAREARAKFKASGDWRAEDFKVRDDRRLDQKNNW